MKGFIKRLELRYNIRSQDDLELEIPFKVQPTTLDVRIFVAANDTLDMLHASHLQGSTNVDVQVLHKRHA